MGDWADLNTDLLLSIADGFSLKEKLRLRGVCSAWRSGLAPLFSCVLALAPEFWRTSSLFAPFQRSFLLLSNSRFVGSSSGCFAIAGDSLEMIFLLNPLTGEEIFFLPLKKHVRKLVFAPNPKPDDYTAVALCDDHEVAYISSRRDRKWLILDKVDVGYRLADLAYDVDGGKVFCLTNYGSVNVIYIPRGRLRRPIVKPVFNEREVFPLPYHNTAARQIFLFNGSMHQVWRNTDDNNISVMRYHPGRPPCWDSVQDLGGYSVFVGRNNPAVVRAAGVQGVKANCVYWMGERSSDVPMVFDMATRTYEPCLLPSVSVGTPPCGRSSCWYFFDDNIAAVTGVGTFS